MTTNRSNEFLTISETFEGFRNILRTAPRHSDVRQSVIYSICNQLNRADQRLESQAQSPQNLERIAQNLQPLLKQLTRDEIEQITETIKNIYLQQRQRLTGADDEFIHDDSRYPIWVQETPTRPPTTIEEIIWQWLGNNNNPIAQQVAMQAKVEFAKALDQAEEEYLKQRRSQPGITDIELERPDIVEQRRFFLQTIVGILATIQKSPYRPVVGTVLPEVFHQNKSSPDAINFVILKGKDNKDDIPETNLAINTTSHCLGTGLSLAKTRLIWAIPSLMLIKGAIYYGFDTAKSSLANIVNNPPEPPPKEPSEKGIPVLSNANIKDIYPSEFDIGNISVEFSNGATVDDRVWIHHQGKNPGEIGVERKNITYGGEVIGKVEEGGINKPLTVTFNNKSTPEAATALLRDIEYANISKQPLNSSREVTFKISNGKENGTSKSITKIINLTTENQAPVVKLPGNKITQRCSDLIIGGISISDIDSEKLTVTLRVKNGVLKIQSTEAQATKTSKLKNDKLVNPDLTKGVKSKNNAFNTSLKVIGNKTKTIVLTGAIANIKTALANPNAITYHSNKDFSGEDSLTVTVNDHGKIIQGSTKENLVYPENALKAKTVENQKINITVTSF